MTTIPSNWLRKPKDDILHKENPFKKYHLSRNPFPSKPSLRVGSDNLPYWPDLRADEQKQFEEFMIPRPGHPNAHVIGFLMDFASRRGRGIGKTAFLNYQRNRIMVDLGNKLTSGTQVLFAVYVLPEPGRTRKFWQLCRTIVEAMNDQGILAMAMWRIRAYHGGLDQTIIQEAADKPPENTIGNDKWLQQHNVDIYFDLHRNLIKALTQSGIRPEIAESLAYHGHSLDAWQKHFLNNLTDFKWRQEGTNILFNDLVLLFELAGFNGGLLLIDEVEKIVGEQNVKERRNFADLIRYYLIDGPCQNTRSDFYGLFLTIHPYVQELLSPHWEAAGLDRFAALSREFAQEYTVYFRPLNRESAEPLVRVYLDAYRLNEEQKGSLEPFDSEALVEALVGSQNIPGKMLNLLYHVMEKAIKEGWDHIGAEKIRQVLQAIPPTEPEEDPRYQTQLPAAQPDLLGQG